MNHVSALVYFIPAAGVDKNVDSLIEKGLLKITGTGYRRDGTIVRFGVEKGKTYRKPKEVK